MLFCGNRERTDFVRRIKREETGYEEGDDYRWTRRKSRESNH